MALYRFGSIEMWFYTAVRTQRCRTIQLCEHRDSGLYSCVNIEIWDYTVV